MDYAMLGATSSSFPSLFPPGPAGCILLFALPISHCFFASGHQPQSPIPDFAQAKP